MSEKRRLPVVGRYLQEEVALATRNSGMPLEALREDVTPAGLHYLLIHFDIPEADAAAWKLRLDGLLARPLELGLAELRRMRSNTVEQRLLNNRGEPAFNVRFFVLNKAGEYAGVSMYATGEARYAVCTENGAEARDLEPLLQGSPGD